jgi:Protein of unknown function (DUF2911)
MLKRNFKEYNQQEKIILRMNLIMKKLFFIGNYHILITVTFTLLCTLHSIAQQHYPCPHETNYAFIDGNIFSIDYSRPCAKNSWTGNVHKIWGGLVPYGKVWRMGGDEATLSFTQKPIIMGDKTIPVGVYTLFILPVEDGTAKLIISKNIEQRGLSYNKKGDVARVNLTKQALEEPVDQFTMVIEENPSGGGVLKLMWENTEYSVAFTVQR